MSIVRELGKSDEEALTAFLAHRAASSMFLLSNLHSQGIETDNRGEPGPYVAAFQDGEIIGVVAFGYNRMLLVQAPETLPQLLEAIVQISHGIIGGICGPSEQVEAARRQLHLDQQATRMDSREKLFQLDLSGIVIPDLLEDAHISCRHPMQEELQVLAEWRRDYAIALMGADDSPALRARISSGLARLQEQRQHWVLTDGQRLLSYSAFTATLPDIVQIGGVWTPTELRSRGFGRAVVAGSLLAAQEDQVDRAVLFTAADNRPAQRCYSSLGFQHDDYYSIVLFNTGKARSASVAESGSS